MKISTLILLLAVAVGLACSATAAPLGARDAKPPAAASAASDPVINGKSDNGTDHGTDGGNATIAASGPDAGNSGNPTDPQMIPTTIMEICNDLSDGKRILVWPALVPLRTPRILAYGECASYWGTSNLSFDDIFATLFREHPHRGAGWWMAAAVAGGSTPLIGDPEASVSPGVGRLCHSAAGKRPFPRQLSVERFVGAMGSIDAVVVRMSGRTVMTTRFRVEVRRLAPDQAGPFCGDRERHYV
ncbi:hypothetical protein DFJ74DRAFT_696342 [Hyaloraphidium curvatum]|nr:hypothetical protein DFJ74DRAFT_696342 [Hyaloraphidium curvatum]